MVLPNLMVLPMTYLVPEGIDKWSILEERHCSTNVHLFGSALQRVPGEEPVTTPGGT